MLKNRRYFGIVFAGSHTVHLALIIKFALDPINLPPTLLIGGTAYALLQLMLITSFNAPAAAVGPVAWRRLHRPDCTVLDRSNLYLYVHLQFLSALKIRLIRHPRRSFSPRSVCEYWRF